MFEEKQASFQMPTLGVVGEGGAEMAVLCEPVTAGRKLANPSDRIMKMIATRMIRECVILCS